MLAFSLPPRDRGPLEPGSGVVAAVPGGSPGAVLQHIYDAHAPALYRFLYRKVGNREDAEDLTAQVFMKAAQTLDPQRDERGQIAWLYQVARTTLADHWRIYYRGDGTLISLDALREGEVPWEPADPGPVLRMEREDPAARQVEGILQQLPENYRRVLILRFLQGYSLKETAAALNITEGNVKVIQYRALQKAAQLRGRGGDA